MILTGTENDRTVPLASAGDANGRSFMDLVAQGYMADSNAQRAATKAAVDTTSQIVSLTPHAFRQTSLVDLTNSRELAIAASYDGIIDTVRKQIGIELENPERGGYTADARRLARDQVRNLMRAESDDVERDGLPGFRRQVFDSKINELLTSRPELGDALAAARIDYAPELIARRAQMEYEARAAEANIVAQFGAGLVGGIGASFRDPIQVGTLMVGGGPGTAGSAIARVAQVALREAMINAGVVAISQPAVQAWRNQVGLESGLVPALENVGLAAVFGGVLGGGFQVGGEVFRSLRGVPQLAPADRDAVLAVLNGEATPDQAARALRAVGADVTPEAQAELASLRQAHEAEAAIATPPAGIAPEAHAEAASAAMRHAEDPINAPPPEAPLPAPKAARASPVLADDMPAPVAPGGAFDVLGKPVTFRSIDAGELGTDAAVFQYKGGGDAAGVTDRLRSVGRWDPLASGKAVVYERADGTLVVADGHQRLGLAKRMIADGQTDVRLDAYVFREADGWMPSDVRAIAAKKNIQEGSGDALDTARILRERPELFDNTLPVGDVKVRQGLALARLSDEAWGMALAGVVPPNYAAHVGAMVPNPSLHAAVMHDLVRAEPANEAAARFVVSESMASGTIREVQESLFGTAEVTRSLMLERTKVFGEATKILKREKVAFRTLLANAEIIERAGNVIERDASAKAVNAAELVAGLVEKLATRTGPVSDALTRAAAAMAEGAPREKAARTFLTDVLSIFERDGLAGLEAQPKLAPDTPIEPGSAEAIAQADTLTIDMFGAPEAAATPAPAPAPAAAVDIGAQLQARVDAEFDVVRAEYEKLGESNGGQILNTDVARELSPEYRANRTLSAQVHEAASGFIKALYAQKLAGPTPAGKTPDVVFTAGGTGAGKTTGLKVTGELGEKAEIIYDTNMNTYASAEQKVEQALAAGRSVTIVFTYRDPVDAFVNGALTRAARMEKELGSGRTVPVAEHARTHLGSREVVGQLAEKYADNPNVAVVVIDNSRGPGKAAVSRLDSLPKSDNANLQEALTNAAIQERQAGRISDAVLAGFLDGQPPVTPRAPGPREADRAGNGRQPEQVGGADPAAVAVATERTAAGEQTLMPGVAPIADRDRAQAGADKPMRGGDAPAGGLFDETARAQVDMLDLLPAVTQDGTATVLRREDAIAAVERKSLFGDLVASCTV